MSQDFLRIVRTMDRYHQIKERGEAEQSRRFGTRAIILAILFAVLSLAVPFSLKLMGGDGWAPIGGVILLVIVAAALLLMLVWMIFYVVLQLKLNRGPISIIALVCLFAALAAAAVITVLLM